MMSSSHMHVTSFCFLVTCEKRKENKKLLPRHLERLAITERKEHDKAHAIDQETRNF